MKSTLLFSLAATMVLAFVPVGVDAQTPTHKPGGFHSPDIDPGESWNLTLVREGIYYYHCHPHPFMKGIIEVTSSGPNSAAIEVKDFKFSPERVQVKPGGTVTWTNRDTTMHTVDESIPPSGSPTAAGPKKGTPALAAPTALVAMVTVAVVGAWFRKG